MSMVFVAYASTRPIEPFWWNTMLPASAAPSSTNCFVALASLSPNRFLPLLRHRLQPPRPMGTPPPPPDLRHRRACRSALSIQVTLALKSRPDKPETTESIFQ